MCEYVCYLVSCLCWKGEPMSVSINNLRNQERTGFTSIELFFHVGVKVVIDGVSPSFLSNEASSSFCLSINWCS